MVMSIMRTEINIPLHCSEEILHLKKMGNCWGK